ncbi:MAG: Y-family DNA polymerase [Deltaproteobacteria bacterium]|jgi:DNA polymerase V|nr:Y-family DNA polymerase [Deltaproteobacteria bacterium]
MPSTSSTRTLWALVDCNNFYASCERLFRPDLSGKPVVVLSNNDGCIVARSNEAKALGIGMGEPEFKVRALLKRHKAAVFSPNFGLYGDISNRVMLAVESLAPCVEQYSIDEAFVPLSGPLAVNADELALALRRRIRQWTGIFASVGIGATRTLAKLAAELAKKGEGVRRLDAGTQETDDILALVPTADVWGIGRRSVEKLHLRSIRSAKDLRDADAGMIKKLLGIVGLNTAMELRGIPSIAQSATPASRRTMVSSRSFGERTTEKEHLAEALAMHAGLAGERLRREKLEAGGAAVPIRTARHGQGPFYDTTTEIAFPEPTSSTRLLIRAAWAGLDAVFRPGCFYAKAGILLFDLRDGGVRQGSLLDIAAPDERKGRDAKLMAALDAVNKRLGRGTVRFGAEGAPDAPWRMKQARRSPQYTSAWEDLPLVGNRQ